jgi:NADH-quinone oxidoreductase subunit G
LNVNHLLEKNMIEIEIDNVKMTVPQNSMVIEAADKAGIDIPRFCYHKKLPIAANCRMCLIEVDKVGKPLPACATPVSQGMRVFTRSPKAIEAQRAVMEFLLINHPLDCPICDQGGECELQDISMGYGSDASRFSEEKRAVADENLGPLIASDMTRCIQCTRCVRFGQEIAGVRELGTIGRGEDMEIKTYVKHFLGSDLSGNIIDLCPVGALTSKPYRYQARPWELDQLPSIAPHDAVGSHVYVHTRRGEVMRVVPREEESVNEMWLSDRDRFSYLGLKSADRLTTPMIKIDGQWQEVDWKTALEYLVSQLTYIMQTHGMDQMGALGSSGLTLEECYLLQKFWRGMGGTHLDHRLRSVDFSDAISECLYPGLHSSIADLESREAVLVIGSDIHHEQPLIAHRLRKASLQCAMVMLINPMQFKLHFPFLEHVVVHPYAMVEQLAAIIKVLQPDVALWPSEFAQRFETVEIEPAHINIAMHLQKSQSTSLLCGAIALNHPQASLIRWLMHYLGGLLKASVGLLTEGANGAGAYLAGLLPHRTVGGKSVETPGFDTAKMFEKPLKSYCLVGFEPSLDVANPDRAMSALKQSEFVLAISAFKGKDLMEVAHMLLPMAAFTETSGTFINAEGRWQSFTGSVAPLQEARPLWKILRVLGNLFNLDGFDYPSSEAVRDEVRQSIEQASVWEKMEPAFPAQHTLNVPKLTRITTWPIYRGDALVRHSEPLQATPTQYKAGVYVNAQTASLLGLCENDLVWVRQNECSVGITLFIDAGIPDNCAFVPAGYADTALLGDSFGEIYLSPADLIHES